MLDDIFRPQPMIIHDHHGYGDDDRHYYGREDVALEAHGTYMFGASSSGAAYEDDMYRASASAAEIGEEARAREDGRYKQLLELVKTPLYEGSKHTILWIMLRQMVIKKKRSKMNVCLDDDLALMRETLPEGNKCLESYNEIKRMLRKLGLEEVNIHACVNNCMLYYKEYADRTECHICGEKRYQEGRKSKTIARKVLRYFPLAPRLQRMYSSAITGKQMRWHAQGGGRNVAGLTHHRDGDAWQHLTNVSQILHRTLEIYD